MQQKYWNEDKWRFTGVAGYLDFKLDLKPPDTGDSGTRPVDWLVSSGDRSILMRKTKIAS